MLAAAGDPAMIPVASEHFRRCAALPPYTRGHEAAAAQLAFCTVHANHGWHCHGHPLAVWVGT